MYFDRIAVRRYLSLFLRASRRRRRARASLRATCIPTSALSLSLFPSVRISSSDRPQRAARKQPLLSLSLDAEFRRRFGATSPPRAQTRQGLSCAAAAPRARARSFRCPESPPTAARDPPSSWSESAPPPACFLLFLMHVSIGEKYEHIAKLVAGSLATPAASRALSWPTSPLPIGKALPCASSPRPLICVCLRVRFFCPRDREHRYEKHTQRGSSKALSASLDARAQIRVSF